jgi:hypothetical protein
MCRQAANRWLERVGIYENVRRHWQIVAAAVAYGPDCCQWNALSAANRFQQVGFHIHTIRAHLEAQRFFCGGTLYKARRRMDSPFTDVNFIGRHFFLQSTQCLPRPNNISSAQAWVQSSRQTRQEDPVRFLAALNQCALECIRCLVPTGSKRYHADWFLQLVAGPKSPCLKRKGKNNPHHRALTKFIS